MRYNPTATHHLLLIPHHYCRSGRSNSCHPLAPAHIVPENRDKPSFMFRVVCTALLRCVFTRIIPITLFHTKTLRNVLFLASLLCFYRSIEFHWKKGHAYNRSNLCLLSLLSFYIHILIHEYKNNWLIFFHYTICIWKTLSFLLQKKKREKEKTKHRINNTIGYGYLWNIWNNKNRISFH